MPYAQVRVTGLRELQAEVRKAAGPGGVRALRAAARSIVAPIVVEAKREVPKQTGRLERSIGGGATNTTAFVKAGTAKRVPYAGAQNYGWPLESMRKALSKSKSRYWRNVSGVMRRGISGKHFLDGAVKKQLPFVRARYEAEMNKALASIGS